jgi:hypothetical protein
MDDTHSFDLLWESYHLVVLEQMQSHGLDNQTAA